MSRKPQTPEGVARAARKIIRCAYCGFWTLKDRGCQTCATLMREQDRSRG